MYTLKNNLWHEIKSNKKLLNKHKIIYNEINNDIINYPQLKDEIKNTSDKTLHNKTWISLDIKSFKKLVMVLNTDIANEVRNYYIDIEELLFKY